MGFKKDFVWGVATAAFQIEGAANERGACIWDEFCRIPGKVKDMHDGDTACDHIKRYKEDVKIIGDIGAKAYRFSISWPRVLPDGTGKINQSGLDFYDALVDELLENGIEPYETLYHWEFPYELHKKGGWLNRDSADWLAEYVSIVTNKLSDRVKYWMTQNEPQCYIGLGYSRGEHAPGYQLPRKEVMQAGHNSMLAHGKAVMAIRQASKQKAEIGYATAGSVKIPFTESSEDIEAARGR
jgi:beta-glucosidase